MIGLQNVVIEFLRKNSDQRFAAKEIASWIFEIYPNECQEKRNRSKKLNTDEDVINQITAEISSSRPSIQKKDPKIKTTEDRPKKYTTQNLQTASRLIRQRKKSWLQQWFQNMPM